jgi:hypothetical protein
MIERAVKWMQRGWWGVPLAYAVLLAGTFLGIWAILEPAGVESRIDWPPMFVGSRIVLHAIASVVIAAHILIVLLTARLVFNKFVDPNRYGIRILRPQTGDGVDSPFELVGSYSVRPPDGAISVLEFNHSIQEYWPKGNIILDEAKKTWSARLYIGNTVGRRDIIVAYAGESGRCLLDYFEKVQTKARDCYGISRLSPDIDELDRVQLWRKGETS